MPNDRFIGIDDEGYFVFDGRRVDDEGLGQELLSNLKPDDKGRLITTFQGHPAWVEYFDAPLIAKHVELVDAQTGRLDLPYYAAANFKFADLSLDEWDRFHGVTEKAVPFVFSRQAQMEFFELLEEFDDDSITIRGTKYSVPPWLVSVDDVNRDKFWTNIYRTENPGWEHGRESVVLPDVLPQLKLQKSRVLVPGMGSGHDAAYFAQQGHVVTGVDFSEEAVQRAKANYGNLEQLSLVQADVFKLPESWTGRFDVIFEHTCYCAIAPDRRNELVKEWRRLLAPGGHLLAVLFVMERRFGPPYGGSEWELRERLKPYFDFLYWTRWRRSIEGREGKELVIYARRKN